MKVILRISPIVWSWLLVHSKDTGFTKDSLFVRLRQPVWMR